MTAVARDYFKDTPIDDDYPAPKEGVAFLQEIGTAFTYQNLDWYGPSYECYIGVLQEYVSGTLLAALQRLLIGDFTNWCIVVVLCEGGEFGDGEHVYLFSDQALMGRRAAAKLRFRVRYYP
jgi:hypothetical protein